MSVATKRKMTPQEYLAFERAAETRHEYFQGELFDMAGASYAHTRIKDNLIRHMGNRLANGSCEILSTDMRVKIDATGLYTYPDLIVLCGDGEFEDDEFDILLNPTVLIEILSESTVSYDRGKKFQHYKRIPTLREYVLAAQDEMFIELFVRQPDDDWLLKTFTGPDAVFSFKTIRAKVPLADIYRGAFNRKRPAPPTLRSASPNPKTVGKERLGKKKPKT